MPEVTHAGHDQRNVALICRGDHFLIAHRASGMNNGGCTCIGNNIKSIAEREECVARRD
jgi:hypothetical protein